MFKGKLSQTIDKMKHLHSNGPSDFKDLRMNYNEQLKTINWQLKREIILIRDKNICKHCQNKKFEKDLSSGFMLIPQRDNNYDLLYNSFFNVNLRFKEELPFRFLITKSLLSKKFKKTPKILWIDYVMNPKTFLGDIYFIKNVNKLVIDEIRELHKATQSYDTLRENSWEDPTDIDFFEDNGNPEIRQNPYFSEKLLSIGRTLPISFSFCLNVHHKVYRKNKLAWEYPDEDLITLCWSCHEEIHKNQKIPCYDENGIYFGDLTPCSRCFGAGWFPEYSHVENGICFRCRGARFDEFLSKEN